MFNQNFTNICGGNFYVTNIRISARDNKRNELCTSGLSVTNSIPEKINSYQNYDELVRNERINYEIRVNSPVWEPVLMSQKRIPELNEEIEQLRGDYKNNDKRAAAFVVFETQYDAEVCSQTLSYHKPLMFSPKVVGVRPDEVIWSNLSLRWKTRLPKSLGAASFCTALRAVQPLGLVH
ncbi:hypothetical protein FF38_04410 [Lucilia cuprina]|uniref:CSC1/OSCA1-like cytosolic domain-containing protein n=1 Tax=Lucilia cuprina TaxID=7375 RepID=A0A0L0BU76_LUCCU|nr:hypothetical protein FF38_04410 [Lucilia cuprina]